MSPDIIARDDFNMFHNDYPDITVCQNGDILILLRECGFWSHSATYDFPSPLSFFEVEPKMVIYRSVDKGKSFKKEKPVFEGFGFDPMIWTLKDGRLMAGIVTGEYGSPSQRYDMKGILHRHLPEMNTVITVTGLKIAFSSDNGESWGSYQTVSYEGWENHYNLRKGIQAPDGTILVPITSGYPWQTRHIGLLRSFDSVRWRDVSVVAAEPLALEHYCSCYGYWEPSIQILNDGTLICVMVRDEMDSAPQRFGKEKMRTGVYTDYLPRIMVTFSKDYGFTWSVPQETGLHGDFPSLMKTSDGELILNYSSRFDSHSEVHAASTVDGVSWNDKILYSEDNANFYCVNSVEIDGQKLTVFMNAGSDKLRFCESLNWK